MKDDLNKQFGNLGLPLRTSLKKWGIAVVVRGLTNAYSFTAISLKK